MRIKSNLKKVLSVVLAASVVTATSALAGLAAGGTQAADTETASGLNLMPMPGVTDWSGVSDMGNTASAGDGSYTFTLTADRVGTTDNAIVGVKMPINKVVNLKDNPVIYFDVEGTAAFNITVGYTKAYEGNVELDEPQSAYVQVGALYEGASDNYIPANTTGSYDLYSYLNPRGRLDPEGNVNIEYVTFALSGTKDQQAKFISCYLAPESDGEWPAVPALSVDVATAPVDLMPESVDAISHNNAGGDGSFTYENGVLKLVSVSGRDSVSWPVNKWVDINELREMSMKIKSENGGFTGLVYYPSSDPVGASGMLHFTNNFMGDAGFGVDAVNGYVPAGEYDVKLQYASLAESANCVKDTNGLVYLSSALLVAEPGATVTLEEFSIPSDEPVEPTEKDYVDLMPVDGVTEYPVAPDTSYVSATYNEDGSVLLTNHNGKWPGISTAVDKTVDVNQNPVLVYDFSGLNPANDPGVNGHIYYLKSDGSEGDLFFSELLGQGVNDIKVDSNGTVDLSDKFEDAPEDGIVTITRVTTSLYGVDGTTVLWKAFGIQTDAQPTEPTQPEEPTTGTPATPDAPYYNWAATSKPENVEVGFDLLAWADFDSITDSPFVINEDGSVSFTWSSYKSYTMPVGAEVNLEENPYLYWSIEQGTGSRTTFVLHPQDGAPYGIYRSYTDPDNMFITSDNTSSADNYIDGSETGCFNMYEWLNENGYGSLDAKMIKDIVIAASRQVDTTINYLFFGPAPTTETEPTETEPTETEPTETEPSETEPSETEPSQTEPSETEPSETEPSETEPSVTEPSETEPSQTEPEKPGKTVDLMPGDVSAITNDAGGTAEKQGNSIVFKAGDTDTIFTYPIAVPVNMLETPYFYFGMTSTGTWDISWRSTALNGNVNPGLSADFGTVFGKTGEPGSNQYGTPIDAGSYAPGDVEIDASGAYTWNDNLPADGIVTMESISIKVGANSELTLNALYFGSDPTTEPSTDPSETEPSDTDPSTDPSATDSTASVTDTTATTAAPTTGNGGNNSPATGENTALAMVGGLLLIGSAGALILTKKKKA